MFRVIRSLIAVAMAAAALLGGLSVPAEAIDGEFVSIRLLDAPTNRRDDPRARSYIVDHLSPGATITRHVEVTNATDHVAQVAVYAGPAHIVGGEFVGDAAGTGSDLTSWTSLDAGLVRLEAGASVTVAVTIAVPRNATAGERYGVIWAAMTSTGHGNIQSVSRVGVRIYLSLGGGAEPPTSFDIESLTGVRRHGRLEVLADVTNTGKRAIDLEGSLFLSEGPGDISAGPFDSTKTLTLSPGTSGTMSVDLDAAIPLGPWKAEMAVTSGTTSESFRATLTLPAQGVGVTAPAVRDSGPPSVLWYVLAVLAVALVGITALRSRWRRRRLTRANAVGDPTIVE